MKSMNNKMSAQSSTTSADQVQHKLIEEFDFFDDWTDRYQYLIDLGRKLPEFPDHWRDEAHLLHGCQSQVWIHHEQRGPLLHFDAISDSAIVSGLIALLLRVYSDRSAEEILATEPGFVSAIGLDSHLSPTRKNGLHAMLTAIRRAAAYSAGEQPAAATETTT
ncbi:MAG: cysteine desulfuration protein SufE [Gammaproteobacteria bacterium]|jgi:cysteine desulfuration protein SufE